MTFSLRGSRRQIYAQLFSESGSWRHGHESKLVFATDTCTISPAHDFWQEEDVKLQSSCYSGSTSSTSRKNASSLVQIKFYRYMSCTSRLFSPEKVIFSIFVTLQVNAEIDMHPFHLSVPISIRTSWKKQSKKSKGDNVRIERILSQLAADTGPFVSSERNVDCRVLSGVHLGMKTFTLRIWREKET